MAPLTDRQYEKLLQFRVALRGFQRWSESRAGEIGLTPAQHQLLLAVRGHTDPRGPTITEIADYLLLRHHSTVELVDRAVTADLVERVSDPEDGRVARVRLTAKGVALVDQLSPLHLEELQRLAGFFDHLGGEKTAAPQRGGAAAGAG
jgi:DNA-binding MarR family transcriptional regulator